MAKWAQGKFTVKNTDKYAGLGSPRYRSSWEFAFMKFCDENPSVVKWASESIKIPYKNPFTGKYTVYVPDFFIVYVDKDNQKHAELVAEDFINADSFISPTLLNENLNG